MEETSRALVMDHFDAVSAIVDRHMSVRYLGGKTERYLRQPEGAPTQDLRSMVNASVGLKLRQFGKLALEKKTSQSFETSLGGSDLGRVRVTLKPIRLEHSEDGLFIIFEAMPTAPGKSGDATDAASGGADEHEDQSLFNGLGHDLKEARDELAETVAALEASNEDLKTSNEEVMSMNEELQSSNEELLKTQKDLVQAEQYLRLAIQGSPVTIFTQDLELKYTYILNQLAEYRSEDVIGKTDKGLAPESHEQLESLKRAVLRSGQPARHKIQITTKEQHRRWFDVTLECLRDAEGKIIGLCGASVDITSQVAREAELKEAKEEAEAASRAKSRFLAGMSHDIRTPLTSLMSLSEILDGLLDQEHQSIALEIHHACNHLLKTLDSVLDLARLQAGEQELPLESVDLNEILEEIRCVFDPESKRVDGRERIRLSVDDPPIHVHGEKGALLRALGNLVGNALKFCPDEVIEIRTSTEPNTARIEVIDKGPGISAGFQKELFKPFTQERNKQKSSLPGSGLGLSITHELVGLMQGSIEVESEEGKGTTMIVRLPLSQNEATTSSMEKESAPPARQAGDALICDDHEATCRTLRLMLKGQPVTVVDNEAELRQSLAGKQTLLLDINLHGKERGIKIMQDLKADPQYRHLRIVAFTAHCQPGEQEAFLEKGFDDYLSKPFQKKDLLAKLFPVAE